MKKFIYSTLALVAISFASCCSNTEEQEIPEEVQIAEITEYQGVVVDASMNTLTLAVAEGDTITFSTMDADPDAVPGVFIGDTVSIETVQEETIQRVISLSK